MIGRAEVARLRQRLDATFQRAETITDVEVLADLAKYLCILVSGYLEQATIELVLQHTRLHSGTTVQSYVESQVRRLTNLKAQRLIETLGSFDVEWRLSLEGHVVEERKAAVDSVVDLRNTIAHGRYTGITLVRIREYYAHINDVIDRVADLCEPRN